jgi:hypothetical protein
MPYSTRRVKGFAEGTAHGSGPGRRPLFQGLADRPTTTTE